MQVETIRDQDGWRMRVRRVPDTRLRLVIAAAGMLASLNGTIGVRGRAQMACLVTGVLLMVGAGGLAWMRLVEIDVRPDEVRCRRSGLFGMKRICVSRAKVLGVMLLGDAAGTVALVMRSTAQSIPLLTGVRLEDGAKILEAFRESGSWLGDSVLASGLSLRS